jgi:glycosyltransferase involved in cell wall biosynthesis
MSGVESGAGVIALSHRRGKLPRDQLSGSRSMSALHIALVTETYPPEINGVAMTLGRLVAGLRARGQRVSLTRPRQARDGAAGSDGDEHLVMGLPIPGYAGLKFGLASRRRLSAAWRRTRPDLVHVATEGPLGWAAMAAARSLGIPVVAGFHTNFHNYSRYYGVGWLQRPLNAYLRQFHNRARLTLAPTRKLAEQLEADGYRNLGVMARGVDTALFNPRRRDMALRQSWGVGEADPALIYVGRLAPEKNLSLLATTFRAIQASRPRSRLVMVGDGPECRSLQRQHPEFEFSGPRSGEDLARHYASADIFLFPSLTETFGNVLLEAMASGLAAVAFDYAAASEHLLHGVNGMKVAYGDESGFMRLSSELAMDPEAARRLGQAACLSTRGLAWDNVLDTLLEDYRRLLAG